jgi:uncharacterized glyoxalase superfamily protein PhnB
MKQLSSVVMLVITLIAALSGSSMTEKASSLALAAPRGTAPTSSNENAEKTDSDPRAQVAARYPPLSEYLMPRDAEIALAESAAPANISGRATIKVLTDSGFQIAREGDNGFVCMVMRGWSAPTYTPAQLRDLVYDAKVRAPICFDPGASRIVMPYYELRSKLGMQGKTPDQIAEGVQAAYAKGEMPKRDGVTFAYMWSADQNLGSGVGHWHPHMMVFAPYYDNSMLGGNQPGSPLPQATDDAGTPFTVTVIPVDDRLAIKARQKTERQKPNMNMTHLTTYLLLNGTCKPAMQFYKSVFGGELTLTMVGESPMKNAMPPALHDKVLNARLVSEGIDISASDWLRPAQKPVQGNMVCLYLSGGTFNELKTFFDKLSEGADVTDPLKEELFGTYGALNDKFGIRWMFHADKK